MHDLDRATEIAAEEYLVSNKLSSPCRKNRFRGVSWSSASDARRAATAATVVAGTLLPRRQKELPNRAAYFHPRPAASITNWDTADTSESDSWLAS